MKIIKVISVFFMFGLLVSCSCDQVSKQPVPSKLLPNFQSYQDFSETLMKLSDEKYLPQVYEPYYYNGSLLKTKFSHISIMVKNYKHDNFEGELKLHFHNYMLYSIHFKPKNFEGYLAHLKELYSINLLDSEKADYDLNTIVTKVKFGESSHFYFYDEYLDKEVEKTID